MAKSKIKEVAKVSGDGVKYNGNYYHDLVMENNDKINIAFKEKKEVGFEFEYNMGTEVGQSGHTKAKRVFEDKGFGGKKGSYGKSPETQMMIVAQSSYSKAVDLVLSGIFDEDIESLNGSKSANYLATIDTLAKKLVNSQLSLSNEFMPKMKELMK